MKSNRFVVGFMFDRSMSNVVLIRKQKPEWQRGLLNGVGGKIENGEGAMEAMCREFHEETGGSHTVWHQFCIMGGVNNDGAEFEVWFFWSVGEPHRLTSMEAEQLEVVPASVVASGAEKTIGNLPWLVALAIDCGKGVYPPTKVVAQYGAQPFAETI
jgi:8-oxo-dGTP diphosphatase